MKRRDFVITSASILGSGVYISESTQNSLAVSYDIGKQYKNIKHDTGIQIGFDGLLLYEEGLDVSSNDLTITMKSKVLEDSAPDAFNTIDSRTYDTATTYDGKTIAERIDDQEDVSADIKNQDSNNGEFSLSTVKYNDGTRNELYNLIKDKDPGVELDVDVEVKFKFEIGSTSKESTLLINLTIEKRILDSSIISNIPSSPSEGESNGGLDLLNENTAVYSESVNARVRPSFEAGADGEISEEDVIIGEKVNGNFRQQKIESFTQVGQSEGSSSQTVNIIFAIDCSGSVSSESGAMQTAISQFINNLPDENYNFSLVGFTSDNGQDTGLFDLNDNHTSYSSGNVKDWQNLGKYGDHPDKNYNDFGDFFSDIKGNNFSDWTPRYNSDSVWSTAQQQFTDVKNNFPFETHENYVIILGDGDQFDYSRNPADYDFKVIGIYFDGGHNRPDFIRRASSIDETEFEGDPPPRDELEPQPREIGGGDNLLYFDNRDLGGDYQKTFNKIERRVAGDYDLRYATTLEKDKERDIVINVKDPRSNNEESVRFDPTDFG